MAKQGNTRRGKLRYELFDGKRWVERWKSINPFKKRKGVPLGEQEIWSISEDLIRDLKTKRKNRS